MIRTLVIGDIHGGMRAVKQIFERANVTTNDTLIFLGDYVDGWSESVEVLDFLIALKSKQNCIFIRGNHDELLYNWLSESKDNTMWYQHGGEATVKSYINVNHNKKQVHIDFLKSLQNFYIDSQNRLFVHAGFTNLKGAIHEYYPRLLYWDRTLWEMALCLDQNLEMSNPLYPTRLKLYHEIFIGHTPTTRLSLDIPQNRSTIWNIDTGAAFKGKLTIMDVETKQYWQSDCLNELYTDEKGRN